MLLVMSIEKLPARIKRFRDDLGWTQAQLAKESGLSQETISRYEGGHMEPRLDALRALAKAFGINIWGLL